MRSPSVVTTVSPTLTWPDENLENPEANGQPSDVQNVSMQRK
jgi:hypothetical protein